MTNDAIPVSGIQQQPRSGEWASSIDFPPPMPAAREPEPPPITAPMGIVLPFIARELPQVVRLLDWIFELAGETPLRRTLYLLPVKSLKIGGPSRTGGDVMTSARAAFADVQMIIDAEGVESDWKLDEQMRDAAGPNSLFRQAAWFFYLHRNSGPWLWLEPDCVPLVKGWDDTLEMAYKAGGQPFFGARMKFRTGDEYLSGAAIYPREAVTLAPALVTRSTWGQFPDLEIAFDVAGGAEVLRQTQASELIQLEYRNGTSATEPRKGAVLYHGDRSGALLTNLSGKNFPVTKGESSGAIAAVAPKRRAISKRKRGDAKCAATVTPIPTECFITTSAKSHEDRTQQSNGAAQSDPVVAPTIGDQIRLHVRALVDLGTNQNRRTRILSALRKTELLPRIAR
jgi:hypothetical protein